MKIRRDIASVPARSAAETWKAIVDLITGGDTVDRVQLDRAASVMEALIADEHPAKVPIVVKGNGPRLVVYCLVGEDAVEAGLQVERLSWNPTGGDWRMTAPTAQDDIGWMARRLADRAPRIAVHDVAEPPAEEEIRSSDSWPMFRRARLGVPEGSVGRDVGRPDGPRSARGLGPGPARPDPPRRRERGLIGPVGPAGGRNRPAGRRGRRRAGVRRWSRT